MTLDLVVNMERSLTVAYIPIKIYLLLTVIPCKTQQKSYLLPLVVRLLVLQITAIFRDALKVASLEYTKHYTEAMQDLLWPYSFTYLNSSVRPAECILPFHPVCCNNQYFYPSKCF